MKISARNKLSALSGFGGGLLLALVAVSAGAATPSPTSEGRAAGLDEASFLDLFLDAKAFGNRLRMVQDTRLKGPDPGDREFARQQGVRSGFTAWMADDDKPIWRVVDARTVFPTAAQAQRYHAARLKANSEGQPPVQTTILAGEECHVFGGTAMNPFGMEMTAFIYLFRVDNVVIKLFVAQNPSLKGAVLQPAHVSAIAKSICDRIKAGEHAAK